MTTPQQTLERAYAALSAAAFAHPSAADEIGTQCSEAAKELRALLATQAQGQDAAPANPDSPLMIAWRAYKETEEYANTRKWAMCERDVDGSLWAAFERGFGADRAIAQVEPPAPCGDAKALRDALRGLVDFHTKPAGVTVEIIGKKDLFKQAMEDIDAREKALIAAALAALQSTQAPTEAAQGQDAAPAEQPQDDEPTWQELEDFRKRHWTHWNAADNLLIAHLAQKLKCAARAKE